MQSAGNPRGTSSTTMHALFSENIREAPGDSSGPPVSTKIGHSFEIATPFCNGPEDCGPDRSLYLSSQREGAGGEGQQAILLWVITRKRVFAVIRSS